MIVCRALSELAAINLLFYCLSYFIEAELWNGFQIISPSKSFTVYAACTSEKDEWMRHVQKCIDMTKRMFFIMSSPHSFIHKT